MEMRSAKMWLTACVLLLSLLSAGASKICEECSFNRDVLDCTNHTLNGHLTEQQWDEVLETNPLVTTARFDYNNIVHVTPFPSLPIKVLSLSHNSIVKIDNFAFMNLTNITEIDLSYNQLTTEQLTADVFKGTYAPGEYQPLKSMRVLKLGNNALHSLRSNLFIHLPELKVLILEKNEFHVLDHVTVMALSSLYDLEVLDLSYNGMTSFPDTLLHTMTRVSRLMLEGNQLTAVPPGLANSHRLEHLTLSGNPIEIIDSHNGFPWMPYLKTLQLSYMMKLQRIGAGALSRLTGLEELHCNHNPQLSYIDPAALYLHDGPDAKPVWPPLTKLWLNDNSLGYLSSRLVDRWDILGIIDIQLNPWVCDCENQWVVSTLMKVIKSNNPDLVQGITCGGPEEMKGKRVIELEEQNYNMRCLDAYGAHPERDSVMLIGAMIGAVISAPLTIAAMLLWRRRRHVMLGRKGNSYSRAYYTRATSMDEEILP